MNTQKIQISRPDHNRLTKLVGGIFDSEKKNEPLQNLRNELRRAIVLQPESLSKTVVALDSQFSIRDLDTDEVDTYTLVHPETPHNSNGCISVLAPIGTAVLGFAVGDEVSWETPGGVRRFRIESVTQSAPANSTVPSYFPAHLLGR